MLWLAFTLWLIRATPNGLGIGFGPVVIAHNYAAEINAEALAVPEEERAWPLYHEAYLHLRDYDWSLPVANEIRDPDSPEWKQVAEYFRRKSEALAMIRTAASRPHMGVIVDDKGAIDAVPVFAQMGVMYIPEPPSENPFLVELMFAHIGPCRLVLRALSFDLRLAAQENDQKRCVANATAMLSIALHVRQPLSGISYMTSIAAQALVLWDVQSVIMRWPDALTDANLAELKHRVGLMEPLPLREILVFDRLTLLDLLQRWYTDDGNGSGRLTYSGYVDIRWFQDGDLNLSQPKERDEWGLPMPPPTELGWLERALRPSFWVAAGSRREMVAEWDRLTELSAAAVAKPFWEWSREQSAIGFGADSSPEWKCKYLLIGLLVPSTLRIAESQEHLRQDRDATLVAIALEQHRRKHGSYPATLAEIDAEFLPTIPPDRCDGQPIKYTLRDGRPLLYSVGVDRDDDGGRSPRPGADPARWRPRPKPEDIGNPKVPQLPDGDWLLWPRAE